MRSPLITTILLAIFGLLLAQNCNIDDPTTPTNYTCPMSGRTFQINTFPNFPSGAAALSVTFAVRRIDNCSSSTTFNYLTFSQTVTSDVPLIMNFQQVTGNFVTMVKGNVQATTPTVTGTGLGQWVQFAFSLRFTSGSLVGNTAVFTHQDRQITTGTWSTVPNPLDSTANLFLCSGDGESNPIGCEIRFLKVVYAYMDASYLLEMAPQLIGRYKLYEGVGYALTDSSNTIGTAYFGAGSAGNADPSTTNSPTWSLDSDNGLIFTQSSYMNLPTFAINSSSPVCIGSLTLNMWLKPTQTPSSSVKIFWIYDTSNSQEIFSIKHQNDGTLGFFMTGFTSDTTFSSVLTNNVWTLISFSFSVCYEGFQFIYQYNIDNSISPQNILIPTTQIVFPLTYRALVGGPPSFTGKLGSLDIYSPGTVTAHRIGDTCYNSTNCKVKVGLTLPETCLMMPSCDSSCQVCTTTLSDGCVSCSPGDVSNVVQRGQCQCAFGNYDSGSGCTSCSTISGCSACLDSQTCQACSSGETLTSSYTCQSQCLDGEYFDGSQCQSCESQCAKCTGTATNCTSCPSGYELTTSNTCQIQSTTTTLCSSGYYYYSDGTCQSTCNSPYTSREDTDGNLYCELCTSSNTALSTDDGSSTTLYYYPSDGICRYICNAPYYVEIKGQLTNCELTLTTTEKTTVQTLSSSSSTAGTAVTVAIYAVTAFIPYDPNGITSGSLAKLFEYTRYFDVTRSAKLEEFYADNRATPGVVTIGPGLSDTVISDVPYHPVAPIMAMNNLHSSFFVNFFQNMESLLIICGGVLVVLGGELLMRKYLSKFVVYYQKIRIAVVGFLVSQFYNLYAEIIFYGIIEFQTFETGSGYDWLGLFLAIFFIILGIVVLFLHARMLRRYQVCRTQQSPQEEETPKKLEEFQKNHENFENLYKDLKDISIICQGYLWLVAIRTILCNIFLTTLDGYPMPQIIIITVLNVAMVAYLVLKRPYKVIFGVLQQLAFEVGLLVANICFIIMAVLDDSDSNDDYRDTLGEIVIITIYISKFLSLITLVPKVIQGIWDVIKKMKKEAKKAAEEAAAAASPIVITTRSIDNLKEVEETEEQSPISAKNSEPQELIEARAEHLYESYLEVEVEDEEDVVSPVIDIEVREEMRKKPPHVIKIFM